MGLKICLSPGGTQLDRRLDLVSFGHRNIPHVAVEVRDFQILRLQRTRAFPVNSKVLSWSTEYRAVMTKRNERTVFQVDAVKVYSSCVC